MKIDAGIPTNDARESGKATKILEEAGVFAIVLECIEKKLSKKITETIEIPTIGIGSSKFCDGQILVLDDLLGLTNSKIKFVSCGCPV